MRKRYDRSIAARFWCLVLAGFLLVSVSGCRGRSQAPSGVHEAQRLAEHRSHQAQPPATSTAGEKQAVRAAAVAGQFYPGEPAELKEFIGKLLAEAGRQTERLTGKERLLGLLVPHAGYVFSARTAAHAYAALEGRRYESVVIIGPPHTYPLSGASIYCCRGFATPLGVAAVDQELAEAIASSSEQIQCSAAPHLREHSIEVQLPFLQQALGSFRFVPILVMGPPEVLDAVALGIIQGIRRQYGEKGRVLFVISSDLAHYPDRKGALESDGEILEAFCSLDANELLRKDAELMGRGIGQLQCTMGGLDAAYVGLKIARAFGADRAILLHSSVSSDAGIPGASEDSVVGYGAVAVAGSP